MMYLVLATDDNGLVPENHTVTDFETIQDFEQGIKNEEKQVISKNLFLHLLNSFEKQLKNDSYDIFTHMLTS